MVESVLKEVLFIDVMDGVDADLLLFIRSHSTEDVAWFSSRYEAQWPGISDLYRSSFVAVCDGRRVFGA